MCGILATLGNYRYKEIPKALIERGRDAQGIYEDDFAQLIQTRLEITKCNVELPYQQDIYTLLFNGEIYNYKDFGSNEWEAIINAFKDGRIDDLDGQYAIIIYNKQTHNLHYYIDEFNIHALYYDEIDGNKFISSNLRSLPRIEFNKSQLRGYGNVAKQRVL